MQTVHCSLWKKKRKELRWKSSIQLGKVKWKRDPDKLHKSIDNAYEYFSLANWKVFNQTIKPFHSSTHSMPLLLFFRCCFCCCSVQFSPQTTRELELFFGNYFSMSEYSPLALHIEKQTKKKTKRKVGKKLRNEIPFSAPLSVHVSIKFMHCARLLQFYRFNCCGMQNMSFPK